MKSVIQYIHSNNAFEAKYTLAVVVPTTYEFNRSRDLYTRSNDNTTLNLNVGIAKLSPKDRYCKKIGRDISSSRITELLFNIISYHCSFKEEVFHVEYENVDFYLVKKRLSDNIRVVKYAKL